ncbi:hypothetical protein Tco_0454516 [Tanacetum coccineum]
MTGQTSVNGVQPSVNNLSDGGQWRSTGVQLMENTVNYRRNHPVQPPSEPPDKCGGYLGSWDRSGSGRGSGRYGPGRHVDQ